MLVGCRGRVRSCKLVLGRWVEACRQRDDAIDPQIEMEGLKCIVRVCTKHCIGWIYARRADGFI